MKIFLKPFKPATIHFGKSDCYVYYHYKNPDTGEWDMFKDRGGLNYKNVRANPKLQKQIATEIRDTYNEKLKAGWSPFGYESKQSEEYDNLKFMPLSGVLTKLLETKKQSVRKRTLQSYTYSLKILTDYLKSNNMQLVSTEHFQERNARAFADYMLGTGRFKNKSFNGHVTNLKIMFNMCVDRELILKNPFAKIKPLLVEVGKNYAFSEPQKKQLKETILENRPKMWMFVKHIYHLFVRPIELLRVKVGDVDLRTSQMIIHANVGKNKKQMPVEIPASFIKEVKAMKLESYPADWYLFGRGYKPGPHPMKRDTVSMHHSKILELCKMDKVKYSLYGWKHTGNVDAYLAGVDVYEIMTQNRHSSLEQTMSYLRSLGLRPNVNFSKKAPKL